MEMDIKCPVCGGEKREKLMTCTDYYCSQEVFDVVQCVACGFTLTDQVPPEEKIGEYYKTVDYISHSDSRKGMVNKLYHRVRQVMLRQKSKWISRLLNKNEGELLDVGSGTGYFSDHMKQAGWRVKGVELSDEARQFSEKSFGLEVFPSIPAAVEALPPHQLDLITLWHVLEHLPDPAAQLRSFHSLLKEDGMLVVAVPNCYSYDAEHYKTYWAAYDVPRHLWHFTSATFHQLAARCGFRVVAMKPLYFDAFYVSMMSEKYKGAGSLLSLIKGAAIGAISSLHATRSTSRCSSITYFLTPLK